MRGIFAHYVDGRVVGESLGNLRPGLAEVTRAKNVGMQIIQAKSIDGRVRGAGAEVSGFDDGNFAPGSELLRRDVLPGFSRVARDVDQAVVGARPDGVCFFK